MFVLAFVFSSLMTSSSMNFLVQCALRNSNVNKEAWDTQHVWNFIFGWEKKAIEQQQQIKTNKSASEPWGLHGVYNTQNYNNCTFP